MRISKQSSWTAALLVSVPLLAAACGDDSTEPLGGGGSGAGASGGGGSGAGPSETGGGGNGTGGSDGGSGGEGGNGGSPPTEWAAPSCTSIVGTDAVTFTFDEGATLTPGPGALHGVGYTGLAALDTSNTLLAEHKGDLLQSTDAGCSWTKTGELTGGLFTITAAQGGRAYAFAENGAALYRIDDGIPTLLETSAENIIGLGVDPEDGLHLRIGDSTGAVRDSVDGGVTWTKQGTAAPLGELSIGYRVAFDPQNLDHVLFGHSSYGAEVTFDGGETWSNSSGLGANGANAFSLAISPVDPNRVWAEALEIGPDIRHIYRSDDGGATFEIVLTESPTIDLINGNLLKPHPTDADLLYFVFGMAFQGYGTNIYRYDNAQDELTKTHNDHHDVSAIVASPADPDILYLGLVVEEAG